MAQPGTKVRERIIRHGVGRSTATPPRRLPLASTRAGEETTVVSNNTPELHIASASGPQWVSWRKTGFPALRAPSIASFLP
eukprot:663649-Lingulodinium_polyedra.AAC.1